MRTTGWARWRRNQPRGPGAASRALGALALAAGVLAAPADAPAGKTETWTQQTEAAFGKGRKERVTISDQGRIRLTRELRPLDGISAAHVWDLARTPDNSLWAATGDDGRIFRRNGEGPWEAVHDLADSQVLALAVTPQGRLFAGTGPGGQVVEITDAGPVATRPDPAVQYIWDLAADAQENLYAATGPTGQLWKRSPDGAWALLLDSKHPHLLAVAIGPDGSVYAGSDGAGLIYRVAPGGKASVVYDAPQNEVRALALAPDGVLYAGTAAAEGGGGSGGGGGRGIGGGLSLGGGAEDARRDADVVAAAAPAQAKNQAQPPRPGGGSPSAGTATPRPPTPGENAVYRIGPDGAAREIFRAKVLIHALAVQDGRVLVGTGPEGQLYEIRDAGREVATIARLDHGQILCMLQDTGGNLLLGTGDPGAVRRLGTTYSKSGSLASDVLDTRLISRFGTVSWKADLPKGTAVALQVRTGNVAEPDETWSDWSPPMTDPSGSLPAVPPARFAQYRALLTTDDPAATPEVRSVSLRYQTVNLAPEIARIEVPDVAGGDGSSRQTNLALKWEASDPNGDELSYTLAIRKDGWPDWVRLGERPLTERSYTWDTTAVPAGTYRLRVRASDRPSNPEGEALERELVSEPFLVDHERPSVVVRPRGRGVAIELKDELTRLAKAAFALDGGDWQAIFPDDGLFDSRSETITLDLPDLEPGVHVLMIRATDAAGNPGAGEAVFEIKR